jgi:hypothetical protein
MTARVTGIGGIFFKARDPEGPPHLVSRSSWHNTHGLGRSGIRAYDG